MVQLQLFGVKILNYAIIGAIGKNIKTYFYQIMSLDYHNKIDLNLFCKELYVHPNRYYGKDFFANKFAEFISTDRYELMRGHLKLEEVLNKKKKFTKLI